MNLIEIVREPVVACPETEGLALLYECAECQHHFREGARQSSEVLENTRRDLLTHTEARRHTDCEVKMAALCGMINKGARDVFALFAANK